MTTGSKKGMVLIKPTQAIICKHCGAPILLTIISGLSLICPVCKKPQNGRMRLQPGDLLTGAGYV